VLEANPAPSGEGQSAATPKIDWRDKRIAPHWSLIVAALVLWIFLIHSIRDVLGPLTLSFGILLLLYPSRRIRAIKPLLFLAFLTALISLWLRLSALLLPFIASFALAYAFDPVITWAVRKGVRRSIAVLALVLGFIAVMFEAAYLVFPILIEEVRDLAMAVPGWIEAVKMWAQTVVLPWLKSVEVPTDRIWAELQPRMPNILKGVVTGVADWSGKALSGIFAVIAGLANLILIPILTIYFLNDFDRLRRWVYSKFPEEMKPDALKAYQRLNESISAFVRGQLLVCLFLAIWIGAGLYLWADVPYAILLGIAAGILNLIPYVGTTIALIVTMSISLFQPEPVSTAVKALIVFVTAQTLEGNLITPRIVGDKVGLHPLIVIFVVLLFAALFGVFGMLIAIPFAASAKVLWEVWRERKERLGF